MFEQRVMRLIRLCDRCLYPVKDEWRRDVSLLKRYLASLIKAGGGNIMLLNNKGLRLITQCDGLVDGNIRLVNQRRLVSFEDALPRGEEEEEEEGEEEEPEEEKREKDEEDEEGESNIHRIAVRKDDAEEEPFPAFLLLTPRECRRQTINAMRLLAHQLKERGMNEMFMPADAHDLIKGPLGPATISHACFVYGSSDLQTLSHLFLTIIAAATNNNNMVVVTEAGSTTTTTTADTASVSCLTDDDDDDEGDGNGGYCYFGDNDETEEEMEERLTRFFGPGPTSAAIPDTHVPFQRYAKCHCRRTGVAEAMSLETARILQHLHAVSTSYDRIVRNLAGLRLRECVNNPTPEGKRCIGLEFYRGMCYHCWSHSCVSDHRALAALIKQQRLNNMTFLLMMATS
jgi:hypothetical protein